MCNAIFQCDSLSADINLLRYRATKEISGLVCVSSNLIFQSSVYMVMDLITRRPSSELNLILAVNGLRSGSKESLSCFEIKFSINLMG